MIESRRATAPSSILRFAKAGISLGPTFVAKVTTTVPTSYAFRATRPSGTLATLPRPENVIPLLPNRARISLSVVLP